MSMKKIKSQLQRYIELQLQRDIGNAGIEENRSGNAHDRSEWRNKVRKATEKL